MNLDVKFYKTISNNKSVNKILTDEIIASVKLKENTDVIEPQLIINFNPTIYNYCIIPAFGNRKYFINDYVSISNDLWIIRLNIDVLETYWYLIKGLECVIKRNENTYNTYLNDGEYQCYNYVFNQQKLFPSGFDNQPKIYLAIASGGDS